MERLDKLISSQRADGRKEVQKLIKSGAVLVNGKICKKPDTKVDPGKDEIVVDGQALNYSKYIYIMMNKPAGVVSATEDRQFKTVIDIIPEDMKRKGLFPVGRLDRDTEGLLLITDDGDFAHSITSPKKHVDKKYVAKLDGEITEDTVKAFSDGIEFSDGTKCRSAVLECDENDKKTGIVTICEGKYHQVKKIDMDVDLLNWDAVLYREYRLMWPLAFQRSSVSYEVPFGALTVGKDGDAGSGG